MNSSILPKVFLLHPSRIRALYGFGDAGLAALSTFVMGICVVRLLPTSTLALYSALFTAFVLCAVVPSQMLYVPAQLHATVHSGRLQQPCKPVLLAFLRRHWAAVVVPAVVAPALGLPLASQAGLQVFAVAALAVTVLTISSPYQTFIRNVLHSVGRHGGALVVSLLTLATQLGLTYLSFNACVASKAPLLGLILMSTGLSNALGAAVGIWLLREVSTLAPQAISFAQRLALLSLELVNQAANYLGVVIVAALQSAAIVATLEAARVAASPIQVLTVGLLSFLLPPALRALGRHDKHGFLQARRSIAIVVSCAGVLYVGALFALVTPVDVIFGKTVDPLLTASRVLVTVVGTLAIASSTALIAIRRIKASNYAVLLASLVQIGSLPLFIALCGPFGLPISQIAGAFSRTRLSTYLIKTSELDVPERQPPDESDGQPSKS